LEDAVDMLTNRGAGDGRARVFAHQAVDGRHNARHLCPADDAVTVNVIQTERPAQFIVEASASQHRQTRHKVLVYARTNV